MTDERLKRFIDCQRCGALVVTGQWREHSLQHERGELKTLPVAEAMEINATARALAPKMMKEDCVEPVAKKEVGHHLNLVLVLTAVEQGADTMSKICDMAHGSWAQVDALVSELVALGKLERVHDVVRLKCG